MKCILKGGILTNSIPRLCWLTPPRPRRCLTKFSSISLAPQFFVFIVVVVVVVIVVVIVVVVVVVVVGV